MGKTHRKYTINEELLDEKSEKQSYFLGFFAADGHVQNNQIRISSAESEVFKNLKQCLNSEHQFKKREKTNYIVFCSKKLADKLRDIGFEKDKTYNLVYPPNVHDEHFIRGFFDGDGHVTLNNGYLRTGFTSVDKSFLEKIQTKLGRADINSNLYERKDSYRLTLSSRPSKKLYNYIYPAQIFLSRKKHGIEDKMKSLEKKTWEPDEIRYLKNHYQDKTDEDLAKRLDRTAKSIEFKRRTLDLKKHSSVSERERDENGRFK